MLKTAKFRFLIFALACIGLFSFRSAAQAAENWTSVRSKNFYIAGNAPPEQLRATAARLEEFRWAFARLYPGLKLDNGRPTHILLFKDLATYFAYLPKRPDGSTDMGVAGYFQAGEDTNYITLALLKNHADPLSTAVHEYVHLLLDANLASTKLPTWLSEGLAEYFETVRVDNLRSIVVGGRQDEHLRLLQRASLSSVAEIFAATNTDIKAMLPERRRLFYAEAWVVVHRLMQSGQLSIDTLVRRGTENIPALDTIQLEKDLTSALSRGDFPASTVTALEPMQTFEAPAVSPISQAMADALLGDLLVHTGEAARGETLLRQALSSEPELPLANASLGQLLFRQEKTAEARTYLEKAVAVGVKNHLVYSGLAVVLMREITKLGADSDIPETQAARVRALLQRSMAIAPSYSEAYRLTALLNFIRDENLDDAIALLQKALSLNPDDADSRLLLAKILLRREDVVKAKAIAEMVVESSSVARQKAEAEEIVKAALEYTQAKPAAPLSLTLTLGDRQSFVVLKRSWLTDAEVARIEDERTNNNFNRIIIRPKPGELQIVGRIERIICSSNSIYYRVHSGNVILNLTSPDFAGVRMTVAKEGESTFEIGCDAKLDKSLTVLNYRPTRLPSTRSAGELVSISFVPDNFRLKSIVEMASARMIAIDDDTLRRTGGPAVVNEETIRESILQSLRKPRKDEQRIVGTIDKIDCSGSAMIFQINTGGRTLRVAADAPEKIQIGWFTVASSQISLACGSRPIVANTVITIQPSNGSEGTNGVLRAIEFVPDGFLP